MLDYPFSTGNILENRRALKKELLKQENLLPKRVALVSGSTIGDIKGLLELFLLDSGIRPDFFVGEYGRYFEEVVFDDGTLSSFGPDVLWIATGIHNLSELPKAGADAADADALFETACSRLTTLYEAAARLACPVIVNSFDYPRVRVMGNREASDPAGKIRFVNRINEFIASYVSAHPGFYILDVNYLSSWYGLERWSDPTYYNAYKYAVSPEAQPLLCHSAANIIKSLFGKNKKALFLDCDNTLWGGVIGDDGLEGITLGIERPEGIAYHDLQSYAKELTGIGVLLGVDSKNEDATARSGFTHPSSVLKESDFASFYANWLDKAGNLAAAAKDLSLGTDSFVFADDNPAEREIVRRAGLGVAVPELSEPERYAETIANAGYFELTTLSEDDKKRAAMYRDNAARAREQESYADYGAYLRSLEMKGYFESFTPERLERITALANKSNQFNLTTRRYTLEEMEARAKSDGYITLSGRLEDKFGDNGLVSEIIGEITGSALDIELWLMSCRVLKREMEFAMFDELVRKSKNRGLQTIIGHYFPTAKNMMVKDLLAQMGFEKIKEDASGAEWLFDIPDNYENKNHSIEVHHDEN